MNPFSKIFKTTKEKPKSDGGKISTVDVTEASVVDQNLQEVKQDPRRRLHHDRMSDEQRFCDATKYGTYQVNGLEVDF
jgi:hypothetical protein